MRQIKLFEGTEDHLSQLEADVNAWLKDCPGEVVSITGNIAPQSVLPSKEAAASGMSGTNRRFAPSDVLVLIQYEV